VQVLLDHLLESKQARWLDADASATYAYNNHKQEPGW
jgi:hypothetical protein